MTIEEFKIEVLPFKNKLFRMAFRILNSFQEAEDTVQEVYIRLWSKRKTLRDYRNIEALAMTITKNLSLDKLRLKNSQNLRINDFNLVENEKKPDEKIELKDTVGRVKAIIDKLPELQRIIIQLRDIEGYEYEEIGKMLSIQTNSIRVNLSRARKKVRDELIKAHQYEYSGN